MNYRRPSLLPFDYATIPDFAGAGTPSYRTAGTQADLLRFNTQLVNLRVTVAWNLWYQLGDPTVHTSNITIIQNANVLGADRFNTLPGWFYTNDTGGTYPDPSSRILHLNDSASSSVDFSTQSDGPPVLGCGVKFRTNRSLAPGPDPLTNLAFQFNATDADNGISLSFLGVSGADYLFGVVPIVMGGLDFGNANLILEGLGAFVSAAGLVSASVVLEPLFTP